MLSILRHPNPLLKERSQEVNPADITTPQMQQLMDDMIVTMYEDDGIGLAAPQVDHRIRLIVIGKEALKNFTCTQGTIDPKKDLVLVNPVWQKTSRKTNWEVEGCLSVPNVYGKVKRYMNVHVEALDRQGKPVVFEASKFFARVVQHETDHINGVLFIDVAKDIYTAKK